MSAVRPGRRVGVFGGTFDPPHNADLVGALAARRQLGLEQVLMVPAGDPWQKRERVEAGARARFEMVQLLCDGVDGLVPSDVEVARSGATYTVDTVTALRAEDPGLELVLLLGADAVAMLDTWHRADELAALDRGRGAAALVGARRTSRVGASERSLARHRARHAATRHRIHGVAHGLPARRSHRRPHDAGGGPLHTRAPSLHSGVMIETSTGLVDEDVDDDEIAIVDDETRPPAGLTRAQRERMRRTRNRRNELVAAAVAISLGVVAALVTAPCDVTHTVAHAPVPAAPVAAAWLHTTLVVHYDHTRRIDFAALAGVDAGGRAGSFVFVPPPTYVEVPALELQPIDSLLRVGDPALLLNVVENTTGVHVDSMAVLDDTRLARAFATVPSLTITFARPVTVVDGRNTLTYPGGRNANIAPSQAVQLLVGREAGGTLVHLETAQAVLVGWFGALACLARRCPARWRRSAAPHRSPRSPRCATCTTTCCRSRAAPRLTAPASASTPISRTSTSSCGPTSASTASVARRPARRSSC